MISIKAELKIHTFLFSFNRISPMAAKPTIPFLIITLTLFIATTLSLPFSPIDNHLVNCGSTVPTTVDFDHRRFSGESPPSVRDLIVSPHRSFRVTNPSPNVNLSPIYHSARVFKYPSSYVLPIKQKGTHLLRLHFHLLDYCKYDAEFARFDVSVNGVLLLLSNFTGYGGADGSVTTSNPIIKEYLIWIDTEKIVITFTPVEMSNFAYVNAIEVISAPDDLVADTARLVKFDKVDKLTGLLKNALETVYRVTVGGPKVTPFNDSLWRTWSPDDEFFVSSDGSSKVYFGGRVKYQEGGASREVGPDNMYNTARVIRSENAVVPKVNLTLNFPLVGGYKYLVRTHFCDIASVSLNLLYFNVYIDGNLAYDNLDISTVTNEMLASPFYADFVIDVESSGLLNVSVGPSNVSMPYSVDAILNGVEIMKINNSLGSLDGVGSAKMVSGNWSGGNSCVAVPFLVIISMLLFASVGMKWKGMLNRDSVVWSRLPTDVFDGNL